MASLATVCDTLLISRCQNILDDIEFAFLYDESSSRLTFPYSKFECFDIDAWDKCECRTELRFGKQDLDLLRRNLQIPDEIVCSQRSVCDGMEAMCILLKRVTFPEPLFFMLVLGRESSSWDEMGTCCDNVKPEN